MVLRDAYAAALVLQSEYGDKAAEVASERADKCLVKGDTKGSERWSRIAVMIEHIEASANHSVH